MMQQHYAGLKNLTDLTHLAVDLNYSQNYHPSDSHKTTNLEEDSLAGDIQEEVDSQEGEDTPEEEEEVPQVPGEWGPPPLPMPQANQGKLVGEPPTIFDGD